MQIWPFFVGSVRRDRAAGAVVSGMLTGDDAGQLLAHVFPTSLVTSPEIFAKFNSVQFPSPL